MSDKPPLTEFDMVTIPSSFQIMKAMLPFLDINMQKNLSLIIRFMELKQTMDFFNYASSITTMSHTNKNTNTNNENSNFLLNLLNNDDFVNTISPYLPENYKSMISGFKMFSSMSDLLNQSNMDISDILGTYMGGAGNAGAGNTGNGNAGNVNTSDNKATNTDNFTNTSNININTDNINTNITNENVNIDDINEKSNNSTNNNITTYDENYSSDNISNNNHFNNNASNHTKRVSEADKGFSIFSNAMNPEQQKLFDDYLKQLDDLNL